jgi:hypothetical protein
MSSNTKPVAMPKIVPPQLPMNFVTALPYAGICCADFMASGSCLFDSYILAFWADEALASNGATTRHFVKTKSTGNPVIIWQQLTPSSPG